MGSDIMGQPIRVLVVEDSEDDTLLAVQELRHGGFEPAFERVDSPETMNAALHRSAWDIVIADYSMPHFSGLAAIRLIQDLRLDVPVIVVSGAIGEETAVATMKAGASDYVMKSNLARLGPAVARELEQARVRRERRAMEEKLRAAERLQLIGQLVLGVAHEIRNPLNCIMAVSEALYEDLGRKPEYKNYMDHIDQQITRMSDLVKDLLDMGRPVDPARMHRDSLPTIASAALALWKQARPNDRHQVTYLSPSLDRGAEVLADGARLQQVIINLVDNAAQQSPETSEIRVEIPDTDSASDAVVVRVVDRGPGLSPKVRDKLFQPFFTTRKGGTGLGLCIVQRVVRDHGGEIELRNNADGSGCTAEVRLPRAAPDR